MDEINLICIAVIGIVLGVHFVLLNGLPRFRLHGRSDKEFQTDRSV